MATEITPQSPLDPEGEELSFAMPKDSKISEITSKLLPDIQKAITDIRGSVPEIVKPIEYKVQEDPCSDEKDTNYFVKLQVGDNEFVHAKIAQDPKRRLSLCKMAPKDADNEIDVL